MKTLGTAAIIIPLLGPAVRRIHQRGLWVQAVGRALVGGAGVALMMWLAIGIDQGRFDGQGHLERMAMVLGMLTLGVSGVIVALSTLFLEDRNSGIPWRLCGWVAVLVVMIGLLVEGGYAMERRWGIYHGRSFFAALALAIVTLTLLRPWWFWAHPKARILRDLIGDRPTMLLYLLIGGGIGWVAVARGWGPEGAMRGEGIRFSGRIERCYRLDGPGVDGAGLEREVGYAPGFETGFAVWLTRWEPGDTASRPAYGGRWHRLPGDSILIRLFQQAGDPPARIVMAPGAFPRAGRVELPAGPRWGNDTTSRLIPVQVDSVACQIEMAEGG